MGLSKRLWTEIEENRSSESNPPTDGDYQKESGMDQPALSCPKCQGEMVQGFVLDITHGGFFVGRWIEGPPKKSFWQGLNLPAKYEWIPVGSFRCQSCGFLESYARPEFAAE